MDSNYITPVEQRGKYFFKREDLYAPFDFSPVNGSKLRQCQLLMEKNKDCNGFVTGTSIKSPQAPIVASVGCSIGKPTMIMYGGTSFERLESNEYAQLCKRVHADVDIVARMGYTSVLNSKAEQFAKKYGYYNVRYGFDLSNNLDVFVESTAAQVQNIKGVDNIVVTVGSGITIIGILYGISIYNIPIKCVYGIGCAPNRVSKINNYADMIYFETGVNLPLHILTYVDAFNNYKGFKYEDTIIEEYEGITLHPRYEAKTFNWLKNSQLPGTTCMWITGSDFGK